MTITSITEFKEPKAVDVKTLLCTKCGMLNSIYAKSAVCSHCLVSPKGQRVKGVWETLRSVLKGLVVKDRETALPSSVITD